jgi:predicted ATP-dependent endonuclease of OLD family
MPYIRSFNIEELAGRSDVLERTLNTDVNVFFGLNGCGKTSLLRILHSALLNQADLLREVPFKIARVRLNTWTRKKYQYLFDKEAAQAEQASRPSYLSTGIRTLQWKVSPDESDEGGVGPWTHEYLPIARLYERSNSEAGALGGRRRESEMDLEARFASNLLGTWKDYQRGLARELNEIQETGLARILERVLSGSKAVRDSSSSDSSTAYQAVSTFLARRKVDDIAPTPKEFEKRYSKEPEFRSLVQEIEEVENKVAAANAPMKELASLIKEMFTGGKEFTLSGDAIELKIGGKGLSLSSLSSGEKQLLKVLVATVNSRASVVIVDEPELSMHVDWQRRLIPAMQTLCPTAQLIVATHSPEIMADIPDSQIFRI